MLRQTHKIHPRTNEPQKLLRHTKTFFPHNSKITKNILPLLKKSNMVSHSTCAVQTIKPKTDKGKVVL